MDSANKYSEILSSICSSQIVTGNNIGSGRLGNVFQCCIVLPSKFAYKEIRLENVLEQKEAIKSELDFIRKKMESCKYAVQTYCHVTCGKSLLLLMECMDMSLNDLIDKCDKLVPKGFIPETLIRTVSYSCIQCLIFLKESDLIHRAVKPSNIFIR